MLCNQRSYFCETPVLCFSFQVIGSILAVKHVIHVFPEIGKGPKLQVAIHHGALTEGILTFFIVLLSMGLTRKIPGSFFMKTWIGSLAKLTLHILGSDLTGGCMNPAAVCTQKQKSLVVVISAKNRSLFDCLICVNLCRLWDGLMHAVNI